MQKALKALYFIVDSETNDLVLDSFKLPSQVVAKVSLNLEYLGLWTLCKNSLSLFFKYDFLCILVKSW